MGGVIGDLFVFVIVLGLGVALPLEGGDTVALLIATLGDTVPFDLGLGVFRTGILEARGFPVESGEATAIPLVGLCGSAEALLLMALVNLGTG